ncbi:hypothetical protein B9Z19DRAFT_1120143 [Tuber borchii]|uniref:Uncharacterized protein n=1 Tax=Tuber borchii TaxID=42251 RepID=A0A2T7A4S9_TUBBO|nr:hypothetical protein B9Z19DRAFT_1120143 [Tuber borchii]
MSTPNGPLQEFFSQFNFQRYTYNPHKPPLEEFERLCQERQWGPSKIRKHKAAFLLVFEREQDPRGGLAASNVLLQEFFSQFNFQGYTHDSHKPPLEEFKRLCQARKWGPSKIRKHETAFLHAIGSEQDLRGGLAGPNVIEFFRKYEYQRFTYDLDAPIQSEFQRLVGLRGWGKANLSKVTRRFNRAVALDAREQSVYSASESTDPEGPGMQEVDLLADWLKKQECRGYRYQGGLPELEFKKLVDVKRKEWKQAHRELEHCLSWKHSLEFESLRIKFYGVVEKVFNILLDRFCQITGFTPWQVLVGLYGEGQESVGKNAAKTILKKVFVNIFDFLDAFQEILKNPPTTDRQELLRLLKPRAIEVQFPNKMMLGVYSALTNRVFPVSVAKADGTLALLLNFIKRVLKGFGGVMRRFKKEAGDELRAAKKEGRVAIRSLLLSREWDSLSHL